MIIPLEPSSLDHPGKRTQEERERDKVLIARMYVRGKSQHEMMLTLNAMYTTRPLNQADIHLDLQEIRNSWLQSTLVDFNTAKAKELARLDEAEREAWEAWERSKEKHVRIEYDVGDDQVAFSKDIVVPVHRSRKHKVIEATIGDIKYLEMVERMIKMRCDILGLFQAQKIQVDWRVEALQSGLDESTIDAVKEKTVQTLLQAIEQAAKENDLIKEEDIVEADFKEQ